MIKKEELEVVDLREKMKLKATNGHPYAKTGEVFEVHPMHEEHLKEKGWAVDPDQDHNVTDFHKLTTNGVLPKAEGAAKGKTKKAEETEA